MSCIAHSRVEAMAKTPPRLDLVVSAKKHEEGALQILKLVRPGWPQEDVGFRSFTEGITNKLLGCFLKSEPDSTDIILIRINGEGTERIIDRNAEIETFRILSAAKCSPPIYAVFNNGMAYGYFPGQPLDEELVRDRTVARLIAERLVQLHMVQTGENHCKSNFPAKLQSYMEMIPTSFDDPKKQEMFERDIPRKSVLQQEMNEILLRLASLNMPIVFSHNDLLLKNIVYDRESKAVHFIDYEYAFLNYQAYDIGDHFCEYAGVDEVDFSRYPDRDYQFWWLQNYLEFYFEAQGKLASEVTETDVQRLYVQTNICACASHFFWGIWALIQAKYSSINFDFAEYAKLKLNEYFRCKEKFFSLSLP